WVTEYNSSIDIEGIFDTAGNMTQSPYTGCTGVPPCYVPTGTATSQGVVWVANDAGLFKNFSIFQVGPARPHALTNGPDGSLWFTDSRGYIGQINPAGAINEFLVPNGSSSTSSITTGPDLNVWFTESDRDVIGRITTSGVVTEFPLAAGSHPN